MSKLEQTAGRWAVIISVVILLNLIFNYALSVVYPTPQWDDYCGSVGTSEVATQAQCVENGGYWETYPTYGETSPKRPMVEGEAAVEGYCNMYATCQKEFDADRTAHAQVAFIVLVVLGIIAVVVGVLIKVPVVATGILYAGVISLLIGSMRFWPSANDVVRLVILIVGLAAVLWVAVRKFSDNK